VRIIATHDEPLLDKTLSDSNDDDDDEGEDVDVDSEENQSDDTVCLSFCCDCFIVLCSAVSFGEISFDIGVFIHQYWQLLLTEWIVVGRMSEFCNSVCAESANMCRIGHLAQNKQSGTDVVKFCRFFTAVLLIVRH